MAAARRPPSSEPANVQLRRPSAMARSLRSVALLDMHRHLAARNRVSAYFVDAGALLAQPPLQFDDKRPAALIAHADAHLWRHAVDLALDGEQHIDAFDCLDCDRCLVDLCQIKEFAPRMGPAGCLHDRSRLAVGLVEPVEAGIGVRLHQSGIASQMLLGMLATTVARIEEQ